jgi:hypothetical protein
MREWLSGSSSATGSAGVSRKNQAEGTCLRGAIRVRAMALANKREDVSGLEDVNKSPGHTRAEPDESEEALKKTVPPKRGRGM